MKLQLKIMLVVKIKTKLSLVKVAAVNKLSKRRKYV